MQMTLQHWKCASEFHWFVLCSVVLFCFVRRRFLLKQMPAFQSKCVNNFRLARLRIAKHVATPLPVYFVLKILFYGYSLRWIWGYGRRVESNKFCEHSTNKGTEKWQNEYRRRRGLFKVYFLSSTLSPSRTSRPLMPKSIWVHTRMVSGWTFKLHYFWTSVTKTSQVFTNIRSRL